MKKIKNMDNEISHDDISVSPKENNSDKFEYSGDEIDEIDDTYIKTR